MADISKIKLPGVDEAYTIKDAATSEALAEHVGNTTIHITSTERTTWNAKQDALTEGTDYLNPTHIKALDDLTNYYKKSETYTQSEIDGKISAIPKFKIEVVDALPRTGDLTTIYLVRNSGEEEHQMYDEYIYVDKGETADPRYVWEKLGTQTVDLKDYATIPYVDDGLAQTLQAAKNYADDGDTATLTSAKAYTDQKVAESGHTHANKGLLDTYDQTNADIKDAIEKKHTHTNKEVLDTITAEKISAWNAAETNAKEYADAKKTEAIIAAASDATTKADAAQAAAETTAAADASAKADAAKTIALTALQSHNTATDAHDGLFKTKQNVLKTTAGTVTITDNEIDLSAGVKASLASADSAVQPDAISDMETKSHAAGLYQTKLTEAQIIATNSGITSTKVTTYDGYDSRITAVKTTADSAIQTVKVNGTALTKDANNAVDIPMTCSYSSTDGTLTFNQIKLV